MTICIDSDHHVRWNNPGTEKQVLHHVPHVQDIKCWIYRSWKENGAFWRAKRVSGGRDRDRLVSGHWATVRNKMSCCAAAQYGDIDDTFVYVCQLLSWWQYCWPSRSLKHDNRQYKDASELKNLTISLGKSGKIKENKYIFTGTIPMLTNTIEVKMTMCDIKQWWNQVEKYRETCLTGEILQMNVISVQS